MKEVDTMLYILTGAVGFVFLLLFDICSLHGKNKAKYASMLIGLGLIGYSTFKLVIQDYTWSIFSPFSSLYGLLAIIFFLLLIYSVVLEVGVLNTYKSNPEPQLVTTGTYGLVRHPGVIWLFFVYLFTSLYFANIIIFIAGVVWTIVNIIYVLIQEQIILPKLFSNYKEYQNSTPMIVPTLQSFKKFIKQ
jgi:protein-S-isoprenylcysteine O-methyltransferase Ste14